MTTQQKKHVVSFTPKEGIKANAHRKEKHFRQSWTLFNLNFNTGHTDEPHVKTPQECAEVRIYRAPGGMNHYACAWISTPRNLPAPQHANGSAADGYDNGAARRALESAGFKFETLHQDLTPEEALTAIAEFFGLTSYFIHNAHG